MNFWNLIDLLSILGCALFGYWGIYQWGKEQGKSEFKEDSEK